MRVWGFDFSFLISLIRTVDQKKILVQTPTLKNRAQKALADCGAASLFVLNHGRLPPLPWREDSPTTSRIRNTEKKETKKIARDIFRSLAPLLGTAPALSRIAVSSLR